MIHKQLLRTFVVFPKVDAWDCMSGAKVPDWAQKQCSITVWRLAALLIGTVIE